MSDSTYPDREAEKSTGQRGQRIDPMDPGETPRDAAPAEPRPTRLRGKLSIAAFWKAVDDE